jgi:hypothetical protein
LVNPTFDASTLALTVEIRISQGIVYEVCQRLVQVGLVEADVGTFRLDVSFYLCIGKTFMTLC